MIVKNQLYTSNIEMGEQIYSTKDSYLNNVLPKYITKMAKIEWEKLDNPFESYPENTEITNNPWAFSSDAFFYKTFQKNGKNMPQPKSETLFQANQARYILESLV